MKADNIKIYGKKALRKEAGMYPEITIRELAAKALIHQDLAEKGFPMIEIFTDKIDISNSETPIATFEKFIDAYLSFCERYANLMRRDV